jgi:Flp pilus assembly protein TadG
MYARRLWSDSDGVTLPYMAVMLGVIIGLLALALDGSRLMSVHRRGSPG